VGRRTASIILGIVFGVLALNAWTQVLRVAFGLSKIPATLTGLQFASGLTAVATAWGSWRRTRWTSGAALAYGVVTAGMLFALPSLLHLPADARSGIWAGSAVVLLFALLCAAFFHFDARRLVVPAGPGGEKAGTERPPQRES
jgi:hypothetical protein